MGLTRAQRLWYWVKDDLRHFFLMLGGLGLAIALGFATKDRAEDALRITSLWLQVFGLVLVAWGIRDVRKVFKQPSFWDRLRGVLRRGWWIICPPKPIAVTPISAFATLTNATGNLSAIGGPGESVEEKVRWLIAEVARLRKSTDEANADLHKRVDEVFGTVKKETSERQREVRDVRSKLEGLAVGGLSLEVIGLVWLLVGVVLGTAPGEVAHLLGLAP